MKRFIVVVLFIILAFNAVSIAGDETPDLLSHGGQQAIIATTYRVSIFVDDQVSGGCLPYPKKLKDKAELVLRNSGFEIADKDTPFSDQFGIYTMGWDLDSKHCVAHINVVFTKFLPITVPFAASTNYGEFTGASYNSEIGSYLFIWTKAQMQSKFEEKTIDLAETFALEIARARDETFKKFPKLKTAWQKYKR